jgi:hypothetical protein
MGNMFCKAWKDEEALGESHGAANFSNDRDRVCRYTLLRKWNDDPPCVFILLNPSKANEFENDNTIARCVQHAKRYIKNKDGQPIKFGGVRIVNIFPCISTDPSKIKDLISSCDTSKNDIAIDESCTGAGLVICAWGCHGKEQGETVYKRLTTQGIVLYRFDSNKDGTPKHPLYIKYGKQPVEW